MAENPPLRPANSKNAFEKCLATLALVHLSAAFAGRLKEQANVQSRKLQHQGKAPGRGLRLGELPALETMVNVKFKFYIPTFSGNGGKHVKIVVEVSKGMRVTNYPVQPGGDFPPESTPDFTNLGSKSKVTWPGLDWMKHVTKNWTVRIRFDLPLLSRPVWVTSAGVSAVFLGPHCVESMQGPQKHFQGSP